MPTEDGTSTNAMVRKRGRLPLLLLITGTLALLLSGIHPLERTTWAMEVFPAVLGGAVLVGTYRRFRFSHLVYVLVWLHALVLIAGGTGLTPRTPWAIG